MQSGSMHNLVFLTTPLGLANEISQDFSILATVRFLVLKLKENIV